MREKLKRPTRIGALIAAAAWAITGVTLGAAAKTEGVPDLFLICYALIFTAAGWFAGQSFVRTRTVSTTEILIKQYDESVLSYKEMVQSYVASSRTAQIKPTPAHLDFVGNYSKARMNWETHQGKMPSHDPDAWTFISLVESMRKSWEAWAEDARSTERTVSPVSPEKKPSTVENHQDTPRETVHRIDVSL